MYAMVMISWWNDASFRLPGKPVMMLGKFVSIMRYFVVQWPDILG